CIAVACSGENEESGSEPLASQWAALTSNGVEATISLQRDWRTGYCAHVLLDHRGGAPASPWTVGLNLRQSRITQLWNGNRNGDSVTPVAHNQTIPVGGRASFGFCADATGNDYLPAIASLVVETGSGGTGGATGSGGSSNTG